jgi:hypothetical protein
LDSSEPVSSSALEPPRHWEAGTLGRPLAPQKDRDPWVQGHNFRCRHDRSPNGESLSTDYIDITRSQAIRIELRPKGHRARKKSANITKVVHIRRASIGKTGQ